jgi:methylmalonyl-CoA/ethylmalonyl-CoA epimerase
MSAGLRGLCVLQEDHGREGKMIKRISHLGIAVNNLEEAREFYRSVFGVESGEPMVGGNGDLLASMIPLGESTLELLQPLGDQGPVARFLKKQGEGIHHICYHVDDIAAEVENLKNRGMEVLGSPKPGAEGLSVFLHPRGTHGVLTELVQKED